MNIAINSRIVELVERIYSPALKLPCWLTEPIMKLHFALSTMGHWVLSGANWIRLDRLKRKWRVVVGQQATLKADHQFLIGEPNFAMAA
jgi:hypothetical protein